MKIRTTEHSSHARNAENQIYDEFREKVNGSPPAEQKDNEHNPIRKIQGKQNSELTIDSSIEVIEMNKTIGQRIRERREALGWSQRELGRRCGFSMAQIFRFESGTTPRLDDAVKIADALEVAPEVLYFSQNGIDSKSKCG